MKTTRKNKGLYTIQFIILSLLMSVIIISCGGCKGSKVVMQTDSNKKAPDSIGVENELKNETISSSEFDLGILKHAPILPLEEVDITEVYDHYILKDTANNQKYHFYDGKKQQTIDFSEPDVHIRVSRNEQYMTKMKLVQNKMSNQYFLDVELRDASNKILSKQSIPSAYDDYYDELRDEVIPLEDGSGFIQRGQRLGITYWVAGYKLNGNKFIKKFQINQPGSFLHGVKSNEDGSKIVMIYNTKTENYESDTLALFSMEKGLIWKKKLPYLNLSLKHQWDYSYTFLNKEDLYLFVLSRSSDKNIVVRYNFEGNIVDKIETEHITQWDFIESENGEVLLIYSNKFLYIYNCKSKEIKTLDLFSYLNLTGDAYIDIRNSTIYKSSKTENIIFSFFIQIWPNVDIYFSGVAIYDLGKDTIEVYQSTPYYGRISSKSGDVFIQKRLYYNFSERLDKILLNKLK